VSNATILQEYCLSNVGRPFRLILQKQMQYLVIQQVGSEWFAEALSGGLSGVFWVDLSAAAGGEVPEHSAGPEDTGRGEQPSTKPNAGSPPTNPRPSSVHAQAGEHSFWGMRARG
jgi:hypothetical protein